MTKPEYFQFGRILVNGATSHCVILQIQLTKGVSGLAARNFNVNLKTKSNSITKATILIKALTIPSMVYLPTLMC